MSAVTAPAPATLRPMREEDIDAVMEVERRAYPFPGRAASSATACRRAIPAG